MLEQEEKSLLLILSSAYLFIPNIIFILGFTQTWVAVLALGGAFLVAVRGLWRSLNRNALSVGKFPDPALLVVFVGVLLAGIGGYCYQNLDYAASNALLADLIRKPWPLHYADNVEWGEFPLVYYVGYYLFPALVGKVLGWGAANFASFAWAFVGVYLGYKWFEKLAFNSPSWPQKMLCAFLFLTLGGLDALGWMWKSSEPLSLGKHIEWWFGFGNLQLSSQATLLCWVPQHAISAWVLSGVLFHYMMQKRGVPFRILLPLMASLLIQSPFALVGLTVMAFTRFAPDAVKDFRGVAEGGVSALFLFAPAAFYILANKQSFPIGMRWGSEFLLLSVLPFLLLEIGFYLPFVFLMIRKRAYGNEHKIMIVAITLLCALCCFRMGVLNDLLMRASIPALFFLFAMVTRGIVLRDALAPKLRAILIAITVFALGSSFQEYYRAVKYSFVLTRDSKMENIPSFSKLPDQKAVLQRLGDSNAFFFRYLAKR